MSCKLPFYITAKFEVKSKGPGAYTVAVSTSLSSVTVGPVCLVFGVQCAAGFKRAQLETLTNQV